MQPDIRYARNDGVAINYQVESDRDLVLVPDFVSNRVYAWQSPYWRDFYERLARSFRLILFDKHGTGLSDRGGAGWAALETRMEDMGTVLEAVGSERAVRASTRQTGSGRGASWSDGEHRGWPTSGWPRFVRPCFAARPIASGSRTGSESAPARRSATR